MIWLIETTEVSDSHNFKEEHLYHNWMFFQYFWFYLIPSPINSNKLREETYITSFFVVLVFIIDDRTTQKISCNITDTVTRKFLAGKGLDMI